MTQRALVITLDGPAGSGKSTVARRVAAALGIAYLDTGAMYRALAWAALEHGIALDDGPALVELFEAAALEFAPSEAAGTGAVTWNGRDISKEIRGDAVTLAVSKVAALPEVRRRMVQAQRDPATRGGGTADAGPGVVTEGRDQGSVVFPDAALKFFLDADLRERASRRAEQLAASGEEVDRDQLERTIAARDDADRNRGVGPLRPPEGAIVIDTTSMSIEEVCAAILDRVAAAQSASGACD